MDNQQFSSSQDHSLDPNYAFDPIIGCLDQGFNDDFTFSDDDFLDTVFGSSKDLPLDVVTSSTTNPGLITLSLEEEVVEEEEEEEESGREYAGEGTSSGKPKRDRSKSLVAERRRRSMMKAKLYQLRSLVPNITKMDKASIIGDAMVYVQSLQDEENKLRNEISVLESSSSTSQGDQAFGVPIENNLLEAKQVVGCKKNQSQGKILNVTAHEVGEGWFNVRVECSEGGGVASALYSAVESLEYCIHVENSDFSFTSNRFVLTLSLNVQDSVSGEVMTTSSIKLWVMGALLKKGFGFELFH